MNLEGLKYFKTRQDAVNANKFVPQGVTINGVALNNADAITITDDTKLSKTDAAAQYLGINAKASTAGAADTAAKLAIAHNINGAAFDGSKDITINAVDSTPRIATSLIGVANGVAPLGTDKKNPGAVYPG